VSSPYLTVQEVAELARCEHRTVRRAIQAGKLRASLVGGRWIVKDSAVDEWIDACANSPGQIAPAPQARRTRAREQTRGPMRPGSVADLEAIRETIVGP
jgi:excisionase family DNA binding protein